MLNMFGGFGELSASYDGLSQEQRTKLAELFELRNEYMTHGIELNKLRIAQLNNPSEAGQKAMREYASVTMASIRARQGELVVEMFEEAINLDQIKGLLPMILLGLVQAINLPLLFGALGLDADMIQMAVEKGTEYFNSEKSE